jgi:DNA polymerase/3'-5' exonuclease PolX
MFIGVQHKITDTAKWQEITSTLQERVPAGCKPLTYMPSIDCTKANCLWEADSVNSVKTFLEGEIGGCSTNEYYQIDSNTAIGLPQPSGIK